MSLRFKTAYSPETSIDTVFHLVYTIVSFICTYLDFLQPVFGFTGYLSPALGLCCSIDDCFLCEIGGLAATDSQLHKLIHPWSLASLGTYTLFFLLTLLRAANVLVASESFCFSSLAYGMVWSSESVLILPRKEAIWHKLNT